MARSRSLVLLLPLVALLGAAAAAQPIVLTGSITDRDGKPIPAARSQLLALEGDYQAARRWFASEPEPRPLVDAAADADGRYRLEIAEPGFYVVRVEAAGFLARVLPAMMPYVEDTELAPARLEGAVEVTVRVSGPDGRPVAGAWVAAAALEENRFAEDPWRSAPRRARAGDDGGVRLPRGAREAPVWLAAAPGRGEAAAVPSRSDVTLRLAAAHTRPLRVRDAPGRPVAQAIVVAGRGRFPLAISDAHGALGLPAGVEAVEVLAPSGLRKQRRLAPPAPDGSPAEVVFAAPGSLEGRVFDRTTRAAVGGALVWNSRRPEAAVRARPDGGYLLAGVDAGGTMLQAVARGYAGGGATAVAHRTGGVERGPAIALLPSRRLTGVVLDKQERAVRGAEIVVEPAYQRASRDLMMAGSWAPTRRGRSDARGRFVVPEMVKGFPYAMRVRAAGFAPAAIDLPGEAPSDMRIVLVSGTAAFGTAVDPERRPVTGARAELRQAPAQSDRFMPLQHKAEPESAVADAAGRFEFPHLAAGRYSLEVRAPGRAPAAVPGIEIADATRLDLGTVVLLAEAVVEGVVVDEGGRPVAGASIVVGEADPTRRLEALIEQPRAADAETSADGWFRVGSLRPRETVDLIVTAASFAVQRVAGVTPQPTAESGEPLRVVLHPTSRVTGRVVDREQHPIAGAQVSYGIERRTRDMALHVGGRQEPMTTDDDGRFELRDLAEGIVHVQVSAEGFQPGTLEVPIAPGKDALDLELVLLAGAAVTGRVLDAAGGPVVGAQVGAGGRGGPYAHSDAEGAYRLDGVAPGKRTITAHDPRGRRTAKEVDVGSGETVADLVFPGGATVSGTVVDRDGLPVGEAMVRLLGGGTGPGTTATTADGRFAIPEVADGDYSLSARKEGYAVAEQKLSVKGAPVEGLQLRLERGATLVGELRGLRFAELPRARIVAQRQGAFDALRGSADFAGRFRLQGLAPGDWQIVADVEGAGRQARAQVSLAPGDDEVPVVLEFAQGLTLSGVVRRRGEPQAGLDVWLRGLDVTGGGQVSTTADGAFRLEGLDPGSYELTVGGGGRPANHRQRIQLDADREVTVDLVGAAIVGRVVDAANGEPLARAEVTLDTAEEEARSFYSFRPSITDSRGAFHFEDVSSGDWRLRAQASGYALALRDLRIGEDGASEPLEIALQPTEGLTLELAVDGRPAAGASALVLDDAGRLVWGGGVSADENGRARLDSVPPGRFTAWLLAPDSAPATVAVAVPGPVVRVSFQKGARLTVRVPELSAEARIAKVSLVDAAGQPLRLPSWQTLRSEFDLRYGLTQIRGVAPGPWTVTARAADGRTWQAIIVIPPGGGESEVELREKR